MRRLLALLVLILVAAPALAAGWDRYENARFGYVIDVPPDFTGNGESANGDGQGFQNLSRGQGLVVWGGHALDGFEGEVAAGLELLVQDGWNPGQQTVTPSWASVSAVKGQRIRHLRMIALCGDSFAGYALDYMATDATAMAPLLVRMDRSLQPVPGRC